MARALQAIVVASLCTVCGISRAVWATPGARDAVFANGGVAYVPANLGLNGTAALAVQPDGKVLVGRIGSGGSFEFARLLSDGTLDVGFGTGGLATAPSTGGAQLHSLLVQADGKILSGGEGGPYGQSFLVARHLSDGTLDPGFGTGGTVETYFGENAIVTSVLEQADGKVVALGYLLDLPSLVSHPRIARYDVNGVLDPSFGTGGIASPSSPVPTAGVVQSDGKIVVAGDSAGGALLLRLDASGTPDATFGAGGETIVAGINGPTTLVQTPDGKLLVDGNAGGDLAAARLLGDGSPDPAFGSGGIATAGAGGILGLGRQTDGKIVLFGFLSLSAPPAPIGALLTVLARLDADGMLDPTFGAAGRTTTTFGGLEGFNATHLLALAPDGRLLIGGTQPGWFRQTAFVARFDGGTCGDGVLDGGEECDDGNLSSGDGCDAHCCLADVDGDGICDATDPCVGGPAVLHPKIVVAKLATTGPNFSPDDVLTIKGDIPFAVVPALDPVANGIRFVIRDTERTLVDLRVPPGAYDPSPHVGWKAGGPGTWNFLAPQSNRQPQDPNGRLPASAYSIAKVTVTTRVPGLVRFAVKGRFGNHATWTLAPPLSGTIMLDPATPGTAECGEMSFPGSSPAGCALKPDGSTFRCQ